MQMQLSKHGECVCVRECARARACARAHVFTCYAAVQVSILFFVIEFCVFERGIVFFLCFCLLALIVSICVFGDTNLSGYFTFVL
jgi:hypothetical protein